MNINLQGVSETLLITLCAKARESAREDSIIKDLKSEEIIEKIDYDFSKLKKKQANQIGTAIRTKIIDDIIKDIIENGDSNIFTIINLGAGLDTRAIRFINDNVFWADIDFEDVIKLRKNFFLELENNKNYLSISSSILDYNWIKNIKNATNIEKRETIIIAEGVLMYLDEKFVKELLENFDFDKYLKYKENYIEKLKSDSLKYYNYYDKEDLKNRLNNFFNNFIENEHIKNIIKGKEKIVSREHKFQKCKLENNTLYITRAKIDLIAKNSEGEYFVLDYKTSKRSEEKLEMYRKQLNIYREIVEEAFKIENSSDIKTDIIFLG